MTNPRGQVAPVATIWMYRLETPKVCSMEFRQVLISSAELAESIDARSPNLPAEPRPVAFSTERLAGICARINAVAQPGFDDLDYCQIAEFRNDSGEVIQLIDHGRSPVPGTAIYVASRNHFDFYSRGIVRILSEKFGILPESLTWLRVRDTPEPHVIAVDL